MMHDGVHLIFLTTHAVLALSSLLATVYCLVLLTQEALLCSCSPWQANCVKYVWCIHTVYVAIYPRLPLQDWNELGPLYIFVGG
jgi:hypothetical protein